MYKNRSILEGSRIARVVAAHEAVSHTCLSPVNQTLKPRGPRRCRMRAPRHWRQIQLRVLNVKSYSLPACSKPRLAARLQKPSRAQCLEVLHDGVARATFDTAP